YRPLATLGFLVLVRAAADRSDAAGRGFPPELDAILLAIGQRGTHCENGTRVVLRRDSYHRRHVSVSDVSRLGPLARSCSHGRFVLRAGRLCRPYRLAANVERRN